MEKRELAFNLYKENGGKKPLVEIAAEINAPPSTVRGWKTKDKWDQQINGTLRNAPKRSESEKPKLVIDNDDLTDKQKMFCLCYLQHFNAAKAYRQAYPDASKQTAAVEGSRNLAKPSIKAELHRLKAEMQHDEFLTAKDIMREYKKQAFADITDFTEFGQKEIEYDDGSKGMASYVNLNDSADVDGTLIQEVKKGRDGVSVKLHDKQKALEMLLKYVNGDELRNAQIANLIAKTETSDQYDGMEDDGFLAALESEGAELWQDE